MTVTQRIPHRAIRSPAAVALAPAATIGRRRQTAHFLRHYLEMCVPMCIGFAVGDVMYFCGGRTIRLLRTVCELPQLSILIVTFTITAPIVASMRFRGMPRRETAQMAAVMPVLAIALLALGWLTIVAKADLALLEHGLMMPAMLVPIVFRLDFYTGDAGHARHHREA